MEQYISPINLKRICLVPYQNHLRIDYNIDLMERKLGICLPSGPPSAGIGGGLRKSVLKTEKLPIPESCPPQAKKHISLPIKLAPEMTEIKNGNIYKSIRSTKIKDIRKSITVIKELVSPLSHDKIPLTTTQKAGVIAKLDLNYQKVALNPMNCIMFRAILIVRRYKGSEKE